MSKSKEQQEIELLHREACARGELSYIDPQSGYLVFTELNHLQRGHCCDSGCRHCPYTEQDSDTSKPD